MVAQASPTDLCPDHEHLARAPTSIVGPKSRRPRRAAHSQVRWPWHIAAVRSRRFGNGCADGTVTKSNYSSNIMVVDDTPANLKLLEEMLRLRGHEVISFQRGRLALAAAVK